MDNALASSVLGCAIACFNSRSPVAIRGLLGKQASLELGFLLRAVLNLAGVDGHLADP